MLELQTQIYIVSGALGRAILILLSWNIILSVLLAKYPSIYVSFRPYPHNIFRLD